MQIKKVNFSDLTLGKLKAGQYLYSGKVKNETCLLKKYSQKDRDSCQQLYEKVQRISSADIQYVESPQSYCIEPSQNGCNIFFQLEEYDTNLAEIIGNRKAIQNYFTTKEMQSLTKVIQVALDKLEANNTPHGNLKPSNILKNQSSMYKLVDGGLPSQNEKARNYYEPPEDLDKNSFVTTRQNFDMSIVGLQFKRDTYAFGIILFQVAMLYLPEEMDFFLDKSKKGYQKMEQDLDQIKRRYGVELHKLITNLTIYDVSKRQPVSQLKSCYQDFIQSSENYFTGAAVILQESQLQPAAQNKVDFLFQKIIQKCQGYAKSLENFLANPKYKYDSYSRGISSPNFMLVLQDLNIDYSTEDIQNIQQQLDRNHSNYYTLTPLFQVETQQGASLSYPKNQGSFNSNLSDGEDNTLRTTLQNMFDYCKRQSIDLPREIEQFGYHSNHKMPFQEFQDCLQKKGINLQNTQLDIIKKKYDLDRNNLIHYQVFNDDYINYNKVSSQDNDRFLNDVYKVIRKSFITFELFFDKFSDKENGTLVYAKLMPFFQQYGLQYGPQSLLTEFFKKCNMSQDGQIYQYNFKNCFDNQIKKEIKDFIFDIIGGLSKYNTNWDEYIKKYTSTSTMIQRQKLQSFFNALNTQIEQDKVQFLQNVYNIKANQYDEIDHSDLRRNLLKQGRDLQIEDLRCLESYLDKKQQQPEKKVSFADQKTTSREPKYVKLVNQLMQSAKKIGSSSIKRYFQGDMEKDQQLSSQQFRQKVLFLDSMIDEQDVNYLFRQFENNRGYVLSSEFLNALEISSQPMNKQQPLSRIDPTNARQIQDLLSDINNKLQSKQLYAFQYFQTPSKEIYFQDFTNRLTDLGIQTNYFNDQINQLCTIIRNNVTQQLSVDKLLSILEDNTQNQQYIDSISESDRSIQYWFECINKEMKKRKMEFQLFENSCDQYRTQFIQLREFENILFNTLQMQKNKSYDDFIKFLLGQEYNLIRLQLINEGLIKEQKCIENLSQLHNILSSPSADLAKIFLNYDQNENNQLDLQEFSKIMKAMNPRLDKEEIKLIFIKIDFDFNNQISYREFKQVASQQGDFNQVIKPLEDNRSGNRSYGGNQGDTDYRNQSKNQYGNNNYDNNIRDNFHGKQQNDQNNQIDNNQQMRKFTEQEEKIINSYCGMIRRQLDQSRKDFNIFDSRKCDQSGHIRLSDLQNALIQELRIKEDYDYSLFMKYFGSIGKDPTITELRVLYDAIMIKTPLEIAGKQYLADQPNQNNQNQNNSYNNQSFGKNNNPYTSNNNNNNNANSNYNNPYSSNNNSSSNNNNPYSNGNNASSNNPYDNDNSYRKQQDTEPREKITKFEIEEFKKRFKSQLAEIKLQVTTVGNRASPNSDGFCEKQQFFQQMEKFSIKVSKRDQQIIEEIASTGNMINYNMLDEQLRKSKGQEYRNKGGDSYNDFDDEDEDEEQKKSKKSKIIKERSFRGQSSKAIKKIPEQEVNEAFQQLRADIKKQINRDEISAQVVFRKFDLDGDEFISNKEFSEGLDRIFPDQIYSEANMKFLVFQKFDLDKDFQISSYEFHKSIYGDQADIDIKPLLAKIKKNMDLKNETQISEFFKDMDQDKNGSISWGEFQKGMKQRWGRDLTDQQLSAIFQYFDKEKQSSISYESFCDVLMEGSLFSDVLKKKIQDYCERERKAFVAVHTQYAKGKSFWSLEDLKEFLKDLNFNVNDNQIKFVFNELDELRNSKITAEEFSNFVLPSKQQNVDVIIKKIRRQAINLGVNLERDAQGLEPNWQHGVPYHKFCQMFRDKEFDITKMEMQAVFNRFKNKDDLLDFQNFYNYILTQKFDFVEIKQKLNEFKDKYKMQPKQIFDVFDQNKDGLLDLIEFDVMLVNQNIKLSSDDLKEAFKSLDKDGNGYIQFDEFQSLLNNYENMNMYNLDIVKMQQKPYLIQRNFQEYPTVEVLLGGNTSNQQQSIQNPFTDINQNEAFTSNQARYQSSSLTQDIKANNQLYSNYEDQGNNSQYIKKIKDACLLLKKDPFQLFSYYDYDNKYIFQDPQCLGIIFKEIRVDIPFDHLKTFIAQYSNSMQQIEYIHILEQVMLPSDLMKKCLQAHIKSQKITIEELFIMPLKYNNTPYSRTWTYKDFQVLNQYCLKINMNPDLLKQTWDEWVQYPQTGLAQDRLDLILRQNENYNQFTSQPQPYSQQQQPSYMQQQETTYRPVTNSKLLNEQISQFQKEQILSVSDILETIQKRCKEAQVNLLDIFTYFDQEGDYQIKNPQELSSILKLMGINASAQLQMQFFNTFLNQKNLFQILHLTKKLMQSSSMFESMMKNMIRCNKWTLGQLYQEILKNKKSYGWSIPELDEVDNSFLIQWEDREKEQIISSFSLGYQFISLQHFEDVLRISKDTPAQQVSQIYEQSMKDQVESLKKIGIQYQQQSFGNQQNQISFGYQEQQQVSGKFGQIQQSQQYNQQNPSQINANQQQYSYQQRANQQQLQQQQYQQQYQQQGANQNITQYIRPQDRTPEDNEKLKKFIDELSVTVNDFGFEMFENLSGMSGWITELQFLEAMKSFQDGPSSYDQRWCIKQICGNNPRGIPLNDLKKELKVMTQKLTQEQISKEQWLGQEQLGIKQVKQDYPVNPAKAQATRDQLLNCFQGDSNKLIASFFPRQGKPLLFLQDFELLVQTIDKNIPYADIENLFYFIDSNRGGDISINEFKLIFYNPNQQKQLTNKQNIIINQEMEKQIKELFDEVDKDHSGSIDAREFSVVLSSIGINLQQSEIEQFIKKYDKSGDKKLQFEEFKIIIEDKLKNEMITAEDIIDDLRNEFIKVDVNNKRVLNMAQLGQVFKNLSVDLSLEELGALFNEIDRDKSRTVDIDELTLFITSNLDNCSALAASAVLNIRSTRKLSIADLKSTFQNMPSNFRTSFTRALHKKGLCRPSSALIPKVDNTQTYPDIIYGNIQFGNKDQSVYNVELSKKNCVFIELKLDQATGIPIPDETQIPRNKILMREVYISFFDSLSQQFIGNSCRVQATWDPAFEDRWYFNQRVQQFENCIYIKKKDYDIKKDESLQVCFEFIIHYVSTKKQNNQVLYDIEMSCCYGLVSLQSLLTNQYKQISLNGGEPIKTITINEKDIRTKRSGFRVVVKALSSKITSQLKVERNIKLDKKILDQLAIMPNLIVMNKQALPILKFYREYIGFMSIQNGVINTKLHQNIIIKTFSWIYDCPEVYKEVFRFWNNCIQQKCQKIDEFYQCFEFLVNHFNIMLNHNKFKFAVSDPTASTYCNGVINGDRQRLLSDALDDCKNFLNLSDKTKSLSQKLQIGDNPKPFLLNELIEDENEDIQMFDNYLKKKKGEEVLTQKIQ